MNSLTLIKPGDESIHLDYVGDGIVLRKRGVEKISLCTTPPIRRRRKA